MSLVFLNGKPVENPHEDHHHVSPKPLYVGIFLALVFLTALTYAVSFAGLGPASLPVAMIVAGVKASLVVGFFMHLKYEDRFFAFIFGTGLFLIALFFGFILMDIEASGGVNDGSAVGIPRVEKADSELEGSEDEYVMPEVQMPQGKHIFDKHWLPSEGRQLE